MHHVQKHILHTLFFGGPLRYAKIKPKSIEGNLFMYHLKKLMDVNLVNKKSNEYGLTTEGLRFLERLSHQTFTQRIQPTVATLIACRNECGEWLLYRRKRQPFPGRLGFPYGKVHLGETVIGAAKREFREKTGLKAAIVHKGDVYVTVYRDNELLNQHLFHVFEGRNPNGDIVENPVIGKCFWTKVDGFNTEDFIPGFQDIYRLLGKHRKERFFAELVYHT